MPGKTILHVDMDAFYAAVEVRDNPDLAGKPLIIGALPSERGVVSTCSYEARQYGVRSAMSISEAYRRCPHGIYMHPDMHKYKTVSDALHTIWNDYTNIVEYISLDEGYMDVTGSLRLFGSAAAIARSIKGRTLTETGLTCSIGVGYCMTAAKLASEEKKPNGYFEIPDAGFYKNLIMERSVRILYTVGEKTAEKLAGAGIHTVRDILRHEQLVASMFGKHGRQIVELANGVDAREVTPWDQAEAKSIGRELTFQQDITDHAYLKKVLIIQAKELSMKTRLAGLYAQTVTLKITYQDMKSITRSKSGEPTNNATDISKTACALLDSIPRAPIRLIGISLGNLTDEPYHQYSLEDIGTVRSQQRKKMLDGKLLALQKKYGAGIIKTGHELEAENELSKSEQALDPE
ncbi:MAG: DNA polymerase IV [Oscillospiraceae bacterium]|jgi:DNA polymerase-4/DNA polymerase IV (DinB-like DNA polymerase)|nr:DNA polymerase IV [Oscillospiraceae bacterium]